MTNWALVIGINEYQRLRSLEYAERDAQLMRDFFQTEAGFEQVFYFSDNSPELVAADGSFQSTRPTYANLWSFLLDFFEEPYLKAGDNFWFFFSGHGIRHQDRDYLMPCDANPRAVEATTISLNYVTERLRRCGADNVVLFLDACRNQGDKAGLGIGLEKQQGVITISSCSPKEKSYEIEEIRQGSFTYALLESLRIQGEGNCATVERLYQRLRYRVTEINNYYKKDQQTPYAIAEPATKYHLILLPRQATLQDIATLREDAQEAELEGDLELAEHLWTRILAVSPADTKALSSLRRIWKKTEQAVKTLPPTVNTSFKDKSPTNTPPKKPTPVNVAKNSPTPVTRPSGGNSPTNTPPKKPTPVNVATNLPSPLTRPSGGNSPTNIPSNSTPVTSQFNNRWFASIGVVIFILVGVSTGISLLNQDSPREDTSTSPIETVTQAPEQPTPRKTASPNPTPEAPPTEALKANYSKLEELLSQKKNVDWRKADEETFRLMLEVAQRESEGWLDTESIKNFSCPDLKEIDRLWVEYSSGRFGFSVQKSIIQKEGFDLDKLEDYRRFMARIGWRKNDIDIFYEDGQFSMGAPRGHLPWRGGGNFLAQRTVTCNI